MLSAVCLRIIQRCREYTDTSGTYAIVTGALAAYLPFSNLLHMIVAPVVMATNAMLRTGKPA